MINSNTRFKQHHPAVSTELDGEASLFHSNTCDFLVLNETGSAIWNALKTQPTLPELCKNLQEEYEVTSDECKSSIETWLEAALEKKVIAVVED